MPTGIRTHSEPRRVLVGSAPCSTRLFFAAAATVAALLAPQPALAQLSASRAQFWYPGTPGLTTTVQASSYFGQALAIGDFDGDGVPDLVIGMPFVSVGGDSTAGAVLVLYGGAAGPAVAGHQVWTQDDFGTDPADPDDFFGWMFATGDFDADGFDDLAVGVSNEDIGSFEGAGIVQILYGSSTGLVALGAQTFSQDTPGMPDAAEPDEGFGNALAAADFDGDGFDDLAIGVSREGVSPYFSLGAVHVLEGSAAGLIVGSAQFYVPGSTVDIDPESGLGFGASLAACRLEVSATPALLVGMPGLWVNGQAGAGGVAALVDLDGGNLDLHFVMTQDSAGVPDQAEPGDQFGGRLACADFDRNGSDDIAVGVPQESIGADLAAGLVIILETGFDADHGVVHEDLLAGATAEPNERLGAALAAGDFDADGVPDLAIGAPGEIVGGLPGAGAVFVLRGTDPGGLTTAGYHLMTQAVDPPEAGDQFGSALAAGRLAGHSGADLAVGAPSEAVAGHNLIGAVNVLFSIALFRDGFESGDASAWSGVSP